MAIHQYFEEIEHETQRFIHNMYDRLVRDMIKVLMDYNYKTNHKYLITFPELPSYDEEVINSLLFAAYCN